jgi:hypothetical protein
MELRARNKRKEVLGPLATAPVTAADNRAEKDTPRYSITVRYDTLLYDTLQNMIRSAHTAQDFTYTSLADFIRAALRAYNADFRGMKPTHSARCDSQGFSGIRVHWSAFL